jgi:hypothetical protein
VSYLQGALRINPRTGWAVFSFPGLAQAGHVYIRHDFLIVQQSCFVTENLKIWFAEEQLGCEKAGFANLRD